jgi:hypothetical protein
VAQSSFSRDRWDIRKTAAAAIQVGDLNQMPSGKAGAYTSFLAAALNGAVGFNTKGQYVIPKNSGYQVLDGGPVWWNVAGSYGTYNRSANSRDFLLGTAIGDSQNADTSMTVNLNESGVYSLDLAQGPFQTALVGTPAAGGFGYPLRLGGAEVFILAATNEAEKVDALGYDGVATLANGIVEMGVTVLADDSSTNAVFSLGLASATNATAWTNIADSIGVQVKAHDTHIYAASKTGGNTVAPTDTTKTYTAGTRFEVWIDCRVPTAPKFYVNGVLVLNSTNFDISAYAGPWFLLAHLVKTSSTDTMQVSVDWLRVRTRYS